MIFLLLGLLVGVLVFELVKLWFWKKLPIITLSLLILAFLGASLYVTLGVYVDLMQRIYSQQLTQWDLDGCPGYLGRETPLF